MAIRNGLTVQVRGGERINAGAKRSPCAAPSWASLFPLKRRLVFSPPFCHTRHHAPLTGRNHAETERGKNASVRSAPSSWTGHIRVCINAAKEHL